MAKKLPKTRLQHRCSRCKRWKSASNFPKSSQSYSGYFSWCKMCVSEDNKARRAALTPEQKAELKAKARERYLANPDKVWADNIRRKFNLTTDGFDTLMSEQNGLCAACAGPFNGRPQVDHDHDCCDGPTSCGKCVRGLLCRSCNSALGHARDSIERLYALTTYLKKWK